MITTFASGSPAVFTVLNLVSRAIFSRENRSNADLLLQDVPDHREFTILSIVILQSYIQYRALWYVYLLPCL
jgi:hypothetical protein